jgi:hypothetical protein
MLFASASLLYLTKGSYFREIKLSLIPVLYVLFTSIVVPLINLPYFDWSGTVIIKQLMYCLGFYALFISGYTIGRLLYNEGKLSYLVYSHFLYIGLGVAIIFGVPSIAALLNASDVILDSGRISITELEPSVATLRPVFIVLLSALLIFYDRGASRLLMLLAMLTSIYVLFYIQSKSTIFILPIALILATSIVVFKGGSKLANKMALLFVMLLSLSLGAYNVMRSDYFYYAYHYTFVDTTGSALSRMVFAETGIRLILSNPLGFGVAYYPFFKEQLLELMPSLLSNLNDELTHMQSDGDMSSLYSPKSGILTWGVIGGLVLMLSYVKYNYTIIRDCVRTNLTSTTQVIIVSMVIFFMLFSIVSEINASFILYLGIYSGICLSIIRGSIERYC